MTISLLPASPAAAKLEHEDFYPFQLTGSAWLAPKKHAFLADDMGLGKSAQSIRAADLAGLQRILVVCPSSVKVNWEREFEKFSTMDRVVTVLHKASDPVPSQGVVIVSYDIAGSKSVQLKAERWDLLILDEAHYLKTKSTRRTFLVYGRRAEWKCLATSADRVWCLSGTPCPNYANELWTHLNFAKITPLSYWDFTFRYCTGFDSQFGFRITGHQNVPELKAMLKDYMLRRTKEQVMPDLPPIVYQTVVVEKSPVELDPNFYDSIKNLGSVDKFMDHLKVSDQTLRQALNAVAESTTPNENRIHVLHGLDASMMTLRRYIGMAKLPAICKLIEEELDSGAVNKIVLFAVHQCVIEYARDYFWKKFRAVTLYGKTPDAKRQKHIDSFRDNPKCRVFIGNIQAAGVGVNGLQNACHEVGFLEQDWVPGNNAQAAMRVHRIGQSRPVRVRIFSLYKSVDEQVAQTLTRKIRELTKLF